MNTLNAGDDVAGGEPAAVGALLGHHAQFLLALGLRRAARSFAAARQRAAPPGLAQLPFNSGYRPPAQVLAMLLARPGQPSEAWEWLEGHLARNLFDELSRPLEEQERRREQELLWKLRRFDDRLATLARTSAQTEAQQRQKDVLLRERDAEEEAFFRFRAGLLAKYGLREGKVYDLVRIQSRVPADVALVAWVNQVGSVADLLQRGFDPQGEHWACVVRRQGPPVWLRVPGKGPGGAWTREQMQIQKPLREALAGRGEAKGRPWHELAKQLATNRLAPLGTHLGAAHGLPPVRHLIVLHSPWMSQVPLEVLTERYSVSYCPSATVYAWLQERRQAGAGGLLAVGDPTFRQGGASVGRGETAWRRLPGTRREVEAIARLFKGGQQQATVLLGPDANVARLDELAREGRGRFRYLHLATHGKADDKAPLRSFLALAAPAAESGEDRLTAERVLRTWKLDADLVTLSACESGLGQFSVSEGHLGFIQALFLAGARSLVLSRWPVDDLATALLMTRFYENLLGSRPGLDRPLPKAAALAEARRWLRGLTLEEASRLLVRLPAGARGEVVQLEISTTDPRPFDHPHYWAAFILIGDPGDLSEPPAATPAAAEMPAEHPAEGRAVLPWVVGGALLALAAAGLAARGIRRAYSTRRA